ncbi:hypothetical protein I5G97_gp039 [Mycobacterium phage Curiosium]|uniref:Lipoprotein n=1 Tax=Mycobacterium phage Curiosium TaxID=2599859 RepID=A0A5J6TTG1_9CAUD|nr:hypothetical protein I5G97_gp039 [Mycobacterium phage Curiosium]QFG14115.1 hypothetical protein PBI_CURIOSIUM_71 [Mycobacterium phage Curiosium]
MRPRVRRRAYALFIALAPSACILAMMLTGCSSPTVAADGTGSAPGEVTVHYVDLPDGRKVLCVFEKDGYGGGLSCDWSRVR